MSLRQLIVEVASALGISTLKSQQSEAIFQFLHGRDMFVALPTGYGKSLCYMALPWIFDRLRGVTNQSVVLVDSPLVALMADQVAQCAVARYVMLCQCGCRLRNQTFLGNKSRIGNSPGLLLSREGVAPRGDLRVCLLVRSPRCAFSGWSMPSVPRLVCVLCCRLRARVFHAQRRSHNFVFDTHIKSQPARTLYDIKCVAALLIRPRKLTQTRMCNG